MNDAEAYDYYADPANREITGPARKHPKDELTEHLSFRISPSLLTHVTSAASFEERSVGSWVRRALRNELMTVAINADPDEVARLRSSRQQAREMAERRPGEV